MSKDRGVMLYDRSHWGLIEVSGSDRIRFLHNQTTNDMQQLQPGTGCDTVFVTSTARTIDLVTAYSFPEYVRLLVSPNRREKLLQWMDRYIFPMDKVDLKDRSDTMVCFTILGEDCDRLLPELGLAPFSDAARGTHQSVTIDNMSFDVALGSGLGTPGYTLMGDRDNGPKLWEKLVELGATVMGDRYWEALRIRQGRPLPESELTEDYNPLEAGLWQAISFEKGCYIGQETIARLNTYQGVKQQLWGIELSQAVAPGTVITLGEDKVGKLTSCVETEQGVVGLSYIRTKAGAKGLTVQVGDSSGTVIDVPFLSRGYLQDRE